MPLVNTAVHYAQLLKLAVDNRVSAACAPCSLKATHRGRLIPSVIQWATYLYDVYLSGFVDELVVQLQDEEGPSQPGRRGPALSADCCVTYNIIGSDSLTKLEHDHRLCAPSGKSRRRHLVADAGETAAQKGKFA